MHLKFFFYRLLSNITIVSDLVGSTYLITGYKLKSEVRLDNSGNEGAAVIFVKRKKGRKKERERKREKERTKEDDERE